jgi:pantothenate kinase
VPVPPSKLAQGAITLCEQAGGGRRVLLGIAGPPGAGKTALAARLHAEVAAQCGPGLVAVVPMDGFHLADDVLVALGRRQRKGAPDTFDVDGLAALLGRLVARAEPAVYAPRFDRELETAIAGAIVIAREARLVIVEGNYLLLDDEPWGRVRGYLDEVWYVETPAATRMGRLLERARRTYGPGTGDAWVRDVDMPNAAVVAATRHRADRIVAG